MVDEAAEYWQAIIDKDLLKYRIRGSFNRLSDVEDMYKDKNKLCYAVYDMLQKRICADCMLTDRSHKAATVHFSIHPEYFGQQSRVICSDGIEQIFNLRTPEGDECVNTLLGMTPTSNKLAVRLIKRVGFKFIAQIPDFFDSGSMTLTIITRDAWRRHE
jgi:hypothetical protein